MATNLPRDALEAQLATMDLFVAMFPAPGELELSEETQRAAERLRAWCEDASSGAQPPNSPAELTLAVHVRVDEEEEEEAGVGGEGPAAQAQAQARSIRMDVTVPLRCAAAEAEAGAEGEAAEPPGLRWALRQPGWLARGEYAALGARVAEAAGTDIFSAVEEVRAQGAMAAKEARSCSKGGEELEGAGQSNGAGDAGGGGGGGGAGNEVVRAWFYFPSLSTRAKRSDLVTTAPAYRLTGFVLAGKPGVLCLEGRAAADIDAYMRYIKAVSWSDIPSHQKKVSERWREQGVPRAFADMVEITDALGERRGERANRGDMKALEAWLGERGVGEAFARVVLS